MPIPAHSRQKVLAGPRSTPARSVAPDRQASPSHAQPLRGALPQRPNAPRLRAMTEARLRTGERALYPPLARAMASLRSSSR